MKRIPIGIENFKRLIDENYYFVDKSMLIKNVCNEVVALYTRPRRFGKTLNMSMLYYFFSMHEKENAYLFENLEIANEVEVKQYQNQYPVIFLSLKDMRRGNFQGQLHKFASLISGIVADHEELLGSPRLLENEKKLLKLYFDREGSVDDLQDSLLHLSVCLKKHYGKKVILLVDEYDVPLQDAYVHDQDGYYDKMVTFIRNVFSAALKTNDALEKGILTGCLRIAKESIFTGLNNFMIHSIFDEATGEYYGFTMEETRQLLSDYGMEEYYPDVREWYDGYLFGNKEIYNPWSVLMYVNHALTNSPKTIPFWANSSGNDIVYNYIKRADETLKNEFECLVQGKSIEKEIHQELTYREMDDIENIYSFMLYTGYLKAVRETEKGYQLVIPNREVHEIFEQSFRQYFKEYVKDKKGMFVTYLRRGETEKAQKLLNEILLSSVSFYDNYEAFYHGFIIGLLSGYLVESNCESGDGRFDISILSNDVFETVVVLECKHSDHLRDLTGDCEDAVKQMKDQRYIEGLQAKGYENVVGYGISFYKKNCMMKKVEM